MPRSLVMLKSLLAVAPIFFSVAHAEDDPAMLVKRQCRSVHLGYQTQAVQGAYMEIVPEKSAPGTYFCALGFNMGYFGIQELADGKKIALFSVWDPGNEMNEKNVPEEQRAGVLKVGEGVQIHRFGGEGTGGQSRIDFPWEIGKATKFYVTAQPNGEYTAFSGYIFSPQSKQWQLMATFRTHTKGQHLQGIYSFVEDFRRNFESAKIARRATFQNGWSYGLDGAWQPMNTINFTADVTPSKNVDAAPSGNGFFLQTGGETPENVSKLYKLQTIPASKSAPELPAEILKVAL